MLSFFSAISNCKYFGSELFCLLKILSRIAERYYEEEGRVAILEVSILTVISFPLKDIFEGSSLILMQMLRK